MRSKFSSKMAAERYDCQLKYWSYRSTMGLCFLTAVIAEEEDAGAVVPRDRGQVNLLVWNKTLWGELCFVRE